MSTRAFLFLLALALTAVVATLVAAGAALLTHLRGSHPAASITNAAVAFAGTLTLAVAVGALAYTVLNA